MKKITLPINERVAFNEEEHTYTLADGTQLSGITSIIHKYLFPCMYDGVSESVMNVARDRGHAVHRELQLLFNDFPKDMLVRPETQAYIRLAKENKLNQIAAEYLVSDEARGVATCIDSVLQMEDGLAVVDYKTTSVLYLEYLQWQLSIEAMMLEGQTGIPVQHMFAIHLPKDKEASIVEIPRLPNNYVFDLLNANVNGDLIFENPMHKISDDTNELLEQYKQSELALVELEASVKYHKDIQAAIKAKLKEQMDEESASKWENDNVTITRSKDSVRRTFKLDMLQEMAIGLPVQEWITENAPKCYTETKVNGNITIKFK